MLSKVYRKSMDQKLFESCKCKDRDSICEEPQKRNRGKDIRSYKPVIH